MKEDNKKIIYKLNLSEKEQKVIYCVVFVSFLILLLFGDRIALHFIKQSPNPNNRVFGSDEIITESVFNSTSINEISLEETLEKINNHENFYLLSTRDACYPCTEYMPNINEVIVRDNLNIYLLNRSTINIESTSYNEWINIDEKISNHFQYTPYLLYFENGKLKKELIGLKNTDDLRQFINNI